MAKLQSFQVSKGWYYALMTMLAAILLLRLAQTVGGNSFYWFFNLKTAESFDNFDVYAPMRKIVEIILFVVAFLISVLYIFVYSKLAILSRKLSTLCAGGFWLLVVFTIISALLVICYNILPLLVYDESLSAVYRVLNVMNNTVFFIQTLLIMAVCVGIMLQGEGRLRTASVIVMLGALCLMFTNIICQLSGRFLPSDVSLWMPSLLAIVGYTLAHLLLVIGWARMITKK
jgi:hypothetical protein